MLTHEQALQNFVDEAAQWFDTVHTSNGMQAECEKIAAHLEAIGYDDDFEAMCDYFTGMPAWKTRTNEQGKFESQLVYLAWGNPYITFDTATGEISGSFGGAHGSAFIGGITLRNLNEFFRTLYYC